MVIIPQIRFQILHKMETNDDIMLEKSSKRDVLTVVDVIDDDTAALILDNNDPLQVDEGGEHQNFTISRFATRALADVAITITSESTLIVVHPNVFVVKPEKWENINQVISVSALDGNYDAQKNFPLLIKSSCDIDVKHANLTVSKFIVVNPKIPIVPRIVGLPPTSTKVENTVFEYKIKLSRSPDSENVVVMIKSDNPKKCILETKTVIFTPLNFDVDVTVAITTVDDNQYFAKNAVSYRCLITHEIVSTDVVYKDIKTKETVDLVVTSSGCGIHEETKSREGDANYQAECICDPDYYLPPHSNCVKCPPAVSVCPREGLKAPIVAPGFWRYNMSDRFIELVNNNNNKFFKCPLQGSCLGGNKKEGRCRKGHDDNGTLCATCIDYYAFRGDECIYCPQRKSSKQFSLPLLVISWIASLIFSILTLRFLTATAMTKKDMRELQHSMRNIKLSRPKMGRKTFVSLVKDQDKSFMDSQLENAFEVIDADGSGKIDKGEFEEWKHAKKEMGMSTIIDNISSTEEVIEYFKRNTPNKAVIRMWNTSSKTLTAVEDLFNEISEKIHEIREVFKAAKVDIEWPFIQFDVDVYATKAVFKKICKYFVQYLDEPSFLLNNLNKFYQQLRGNLSCLHNFKFKLGKYNKKHVIDVNLCHRFTNI